MEFFKWFNCKEIIHIRLEYFIYEFKLFELRIVAWNYDCLLRINITYWKPYNYVQTNDL